MEETVEPERAGQERLCTCSKSVAGQPVVEHRGLSPLLPPLREKKTIVTTRLRGRQEAWDGQRGKAREGRPG